MVVVVVVGNREGILVGGIGGFDRKERMDLDGQDLRETKKKVNNASQQRQESKFYEKWREAVATSLAWRDVAGDEWSA